MTSSITRIVRRFSVGLINSTSSPTSFATTLNFDDDIKQFTKPCLMWNALQKDASAKKLEPEDHLNKVRQEAKEFFRGDLFDREQLVKGLDKILLAEGSFALVLGGKSTGKSVVLRHFIQELKNPSMNTMAISVDARASGSDLAKGIIEAIVELQKDDQGLLGDSISYFKAYAKPAILALFKSALPPALTLGGVPFSKEFVELAQKFSSDILEQSVVSEEQLFKDVVNIFIALAKKQKKFPCILIDEANKAFAVDTVEEQMAAHSALDFLTKLTKQERALNVVFFSSENAYPFDLHHKLNFNVTNFTKTIFAGEIPPVHMRRLLVEEWGMGKNLADSCLASYGGHPWHTSLALSELSVRNEISAEQGCAAIGRVYGGITECLAAESAESKYSGMTDLLHQMAQTGFAQILDPLDARAELISLHNVGGVVQNTSLVVGLPSAVWMEGAKYGIVPSCQTVRLMIAELLNQRASQG